ncbi:heterokaryon incompatibility protein-domain-containing protein [Leptodontidium sp. MPI-SDFR-AT-0119]|nr:heterokaryon incompatibility protein-domain-containing protein [Leptodontidium sp. MPI-SDFR-AT-0119]
MMITINEYRLSKRIKGEKVHANKKLNHSKHKKKEKKKESYKTKRTEESYKKGEEEEFYKKEGEEGRSRIRRRRPRINSHQPTTNHRQSTRHPTSSNEDGFQVPSLKIEAAAKRNGMKRYPSPQRQRPPMKKAKETRKHLTSHLGTDIEIDERIIYYLPMIRSTENSSTGKFPCGVAPANVSCREICVFIVNEMKLIPLKAGEIRVLKIQTLSNASYQRAGRTRNIFSSSSTSGQTENMGAIRLCPSDDLVECTIENVSLTAYIPSYLQVKNITDRQESWNLFCAERSLPLFPLPGWRRPIASRKEVNNLLAYHSSSPPYFAPRFQWGDFEALSYVWGPPDAKGRISINGKIVKVQESVELALRRLRELPETRCGMKYWIDAICIDQNNVGERNIQVKRMYEIYEKALSVVVWLGEETPGSNRAVDLIVKVAKDEKEHEDLGRYSRAPSSGFAGSDWASLISLLERPYWRRVWIVQELALNHNHTAFICGERMFFRDELELTLQFCFASIVAIRTALSQSSNETLPALFDPWPVFAHHHSLITKQKALPDDEFPNFEVLNLSQQGEATNDRDRIYGIHGLLDPDLRAIVRIDYNLSVTDVYIDFANVFLQSKGLADLLMWGGNFGRRDLPTWVPDWTVPPVRNHIRIMMEKHANGQFPLGYSISSDKKVLICKGKMVATINQVSAATLEPADLCNQEPQTDPISKSLKETAPFEDDPMLCRILKETLIMEHPAGNGDPTQRTLLEIPWRYHKPGWEPGLRPQNYKAFWEQVHSNGYFPAFDKFRKANADFQYRGRKLQHFFPEFWPRVNVYPEDSYLYPKSLPTPPVNPIMRDVKHDAQLAAISCVDRRLITTAEGHLGLAPQNAREGDIIVIVDCPFPIILRRIGEHYTLVGEGFVHGIMNGEAMASRRG